MNAIGEVNVDQVGTYELRFERADAAGNLAEVLTRTVEVVNDDPVDFSLSGNEIEENLPSGTLIGNFAASDPNDPNGSGIYNFEILTESQKEFFVIDENHSLRTNQSLDFENGEVREFTVRVTDAFGGSFEKQVQVKVLDAFASIVYTIVPVEIGLNHVVAAGEVVDEGGLGGVEERGFLLSSSPDPTLVSETASVHAVGYGGGAFQTRIDGLLPDKKYYYRAYSANGEGVSYGSSHAFRTQESSIGPVWADAIPSTEAQGWWESPWFGSFHMQDKSGWMHHSELGWAYSMPSAGGGGLVLVGLYGLVLDRCGDLSIYLCVRIPIMALFLRTN